MTTSELIAIVRDSLPHNISLVCSLGRTSDAAFAEFPKQSLFLDSLGDVVPVACGLALGLPTHPIVALDTDGSHLMGLASLPVVASLKSRLANVVIIVCDNQLYESAGGLPSRRCAINWRLLGAAFDMPVTTVSTETELRASLVGAFEGFRYIVADIKNTDPLPPATKTLDGIESKYTFVRHLERLTGAVLMRPSVKS